MDSLLAGAETGGAAEPPELRMSVQSPDTRIANTAFMNVPHGKEQGREPSSNESTTEHLAKSQAQDTLLLQPYDGSGSARRPSTSTVSGLSDIGSQRIGRPNTFLDLSSPSRHA